MALFIGSLVAFALVITALSFSLLFRGEALQIGCDGRKDNPDCEHENTCGTVCQQDST